MSRTFLVMQDEEGRWWSVSFLGNTNGRLGVYGYVEGPFASKREAEVSQREYNRNVGSRGADSYSVTVRGLESPAGE